MVTALITLHVLIMFTAVAVSQGPTFLMHAAMRRGDVAAIQGISRQYSSLGRLIGPLFGVGVLVGLVTVFVGGYDPFAPWLLIAYGLTLIAFATPQLVTGPRIARVSQAAATSPTDAPSPELRDAMASAAGPVYWLDAALLVLFIIDMVVKPFS